MITDKFFVRIVILFVRIRFFFVYSQWLYKKSNTTSKSHWSLFMNFPEKNTETNAACIEEVRLHLHKSNNVQLAEIRNSNQGLGGFATVRGMSTAQKS